MNETMRYRCDGMKCPEIRSCVLKYCDRRNLIMAPTENPAEVRLIARRKVSPARLPEAEALYAELLRLTRTEAGCLAYDLGQGVQDPQDFVLVEIWQDQAALTAHQHTEHFTRIVPQLKAMSEVEDVTFYRNFQL
jgi:quinol monooxygenase YgiN